VAGALMGLGRHAEAQLLLRRCATNENAPPVTRSSAYSLLASSLRAEGRNEEAALMWEASGNLDFEKTPEEQKVRQARIDSEAASLLAIARYFRESDKPDQARAAAQAALNKADLPPDLVCRAYLEIGALAEEIPDKLEAYEKIVALAHAPAENVSQALLAVGVLHLEQGNKERARGAFGRLIEMDDARPEDREKARAHLDEMD
jgi:tetratricopeptide (TPR) repeat protein